MTIEIVETDTFQRWMDRLRDAVARTRILARLRRASMGNLGDWKAVGGGVAEMRVDHGPGYRIYFVRRGNRMIVILGAGTKRTQSTDIETAITIASHLKG